MEECSSKGNGMIHSDSSKDSSACTRLTELSQGGLHVHVWTVLPHRHIMVCGVRCAVCLSQH
jgi:hypothetical protein